MADFDITIADNIAGTIATKIKAIGTASRSTYNAVEKLKTSLAGFATTSSVFNQTVSSASKLTTAVNRTNSAVGALRGNVTQLNQGLNRTATTAGQAARNITQAGQAAQRAQNQFGGFSNTTRQLVSLLAAGLGVRAFIQAADTATTVANKVRLASSSLEDFNRNQAAVYAIAIQNRVAVGGVATAFQRYSVALQGVTNSKGVLKFVDLLSKSLVTNGATVSEADAAITQLSQAFQKGKLDGDEFRTIMETLPAISGALTKALGKTKQELFELSKTGKITPQVILKAFLGSAKGIEDAFKSTVPTIEQSLTVLQNQFSLFLAGNSLASKLLAQSILLIGNNLSIIIPLVLAFGAAWAVVQIAAIVTDLHAMISALIIMAPTFIPAIIAVTDFTLGLLAGLAALYAIAAGVAFLTGNLDGFNKWLADTGVGIAKFIGDLGGVAQQSFGMDKLTASTNQLAASVAGADDQTKKLSQSQLQLGTDATTGLAKATAAYQQFYPQIDVLIWKLRGGQEQATKLYQALQKVGGSQGSIQALGPSSSNPDIQTIGRPTGRGTGFASGGEFMVNGRGGVDTNRVSFNATRGERVKIETPSQQRQSDGGYHVDNSRNVTLVVYAADADSFRRSKRQIGADLANMVGAQ